MMKLPVGLLLSLLAFGLMASPVRAAPKGKRKKVNVTIQDPKLEEALKPAAVSHKTVESGDLPSALVKGHPVQDQASATELPEAKMSQVNLQPLKNFVEQKDWESLVETIDFWLIARKDLHVGERLRLELIKSIALARLGRGTEALRRLEFYKKYLELSVAGLIYSKDLLRVKNLQAHLLLTEYDINQMKELSP